MAIGTPQCIWDLRAQLGEGPVWVAREQALWFTDIKSRKLHRLDPATGERRSYDAPAQPGFVLPSADGGFVAGLQGGLHRFDPATGRFSLLAEVDRHRPENRINDAVVDPSGRLWFGTMDDGEREPTGALLTLDADGSIREVERKWPITNGPAASPDGRTLYQVDTLGMEIEAYPVDPDGNVGEGRPFVRIEDGAGNPDGPSVDAEGNVWLGLYGGWQARRYSPSGALLDTVAFPVANITKIAFGGPDLRTAFATSAAQKLTAEALAGQKLAGGLFAFEVDVPGLQPTEISIGI